MIVGHGLMATAFTPIGRECRGIVVHAAGVSNSGCEDAREFERERLALERTLASASTADCMIYFSTCSVSDSASRETAYVRHKLAMEALVRAHPRHLILRLPQVAGRTPNPHTLLNYLHARIVRGERFAVWGRARRNVIDCDDVAAVARVAIEAGVRAATLDIASPRDHALPEIVATMERVTHGHAVYDVLDRGAAYPIDVAPIARFIAAAGVDFDEGYLERVLRKYYAN
jgi:nucleoside-diphosphate-sugar epimerase